MPSTGFIAPSLAELEYHYDGSWAGFFCCIYEGVYAKELPMAIWSEEDAQPSLYRTKLILTEKEKAFRVQESVSKKIGSRALELLQTVFFTCMPQKELAMLQFLFLGYKEGRQTPWMFGHPQVQPLLKAEKHLLAETHLLRGFVRFSEHGGRLVAVISPKNFVLPFLANHFVGRFPCEEFLIYDKTHGAALIYEDGRQNIIPLSGLEADAADEGEKNWQALWKQFYRTVSIEGRENPRCRMGHMPKRYWQHMLEVQDLL